MAVFKKINIEEEYIYATNQVGGTPGGTSTCVAISPIRGNITRVGVAFSSSVSSTASLAARVFNATGSVVVQASTAVSTSQLSLGVAAIYDLSASVAVVEGDGIQFTTSGGPTSAASATCFAVIVPPPIYST